jgi:hypothetical protein
MIILNLISRGYAGKPPIDIPYDSASFDSPDRYFMHLYLD